jgi:hypothetical protein
MPSITSSRKETGKRVGKDQQRPCQKKGKNPATTEFTSSNAVTIYNSSRTYLRNRHLIPLAL